MSTLPKSQHRRDVSPVKQLEADGLLLLMICAFGITVIVVRVFLELSGYPQIGDSTFHIAHLLWGGLLLFIAIVLVLVVSNRWALWLAALLGGIGVGLFIDEVGKFITQKNDYFYPLALPIIYGFFVICVWLYFRVRRSESRSTRTLFYHAFVYLQDILDRNLDHTEDSELMSELHQVAVSSDNHYESDLAAALLKFAKAEYPQVEQAPGFFERALKRLVAFAAAYPPIKILKSLVILGFVLVAAGAFGKLVWLIGLSPIATSGPKSTLSDIVVISGKSQYVVSHPYLLVANAFFIAVVGLASIAAVLMLMRGDERLGLRVGTIGLITALTIVNLVTFYFSQFYAMADALGEVVLMGIVQVYRWRILFLRPPS